MTLQKNLKRCRQQHKNFFNAVGNSAKKYLVLSVILLTNFKRFKWHHLKIWNTVADSASKFLFWTETTFKQSKNSKFKKPFQGHTSEYWSNENNFLFGLTHTKFFTLSLTAVKQKSREIKGNVRPQTSTFWIFSPSSWVTYPYRCDLSKNPGDEYLMLGLLDVTDWLTGNRNSWPSSRLVVNG